MSVVWIIKSSFILFYLFSERNNKVIEFLRSSVVSERYFVFSSVEQFVMTRHLTLWRADGLVTSSQSTTKTRPTEQKWNKFILYFPRKLFEPNKLGTINSVILEILLVKGKIMDSSFPGGLSFQYFSFISHLRLAEHRIKYFYRDFVAETEIETE